MSNVCECKADDAGFEVQQRFECQPCLSLAIILLLQFTVLCNEHQLTRKGWLMLPLLQEQKQKPGTGFL